MMKKILFGVLLFCSVNSHALIKTAVTISDGSLQAGTTAGFNVSSATVQSFNVSTMTVQRAVKWRDNYTQSYPYPVINLKDPPYNLSTSNTGIQNSAAINAAIDAAQTGEHIIIPYGEFLIDTQIDIDKNRITLEGISTEASVLKYRPTGTNRRLCLVNGSVDNVAFQNFTVQGSTTMGIGIRAFVVSAGATRITWDSVNFTQWDRQALDLSDGIHYVDIRNCRFLRIQDTTSTNLATAISIAGNDYDIHDNAFSENDLSITINGGAKMRIFSNTFESDGDSNNSQIGENVKIVGTTEANLHGNYFEGEDPNGGQVVTVRDTFNTVISENYFNGTLPGNIPASGIFVKVEGTDTRNCVIRDNNLIDPTTYFFWATVPRVQLINNYYEKGSVEISSASGLSNYLLGDEMFETDMPAILTWNPANILSNTAEMSSPFTLLMSSNGDHVDVYPPYGLQGMSATGYVENSTGTIRVILYNTTTAAVNLGSGDWAVRVKRWFR